MNYLLIVYLLLVFSLLIFLILITINTLFLIYSSIKGSPYVATNKKKLAKIFSQVSFKKNKNFFELGCGDGRILRYVVKKYQLKGLGVDINPLLILWARILTKLDKFDKQIVFIRKNILDINLKNTNYIYIFLMPDLIRKVVNKMNKELKKGVIVISHGFKLDGWEKKLYKILKDKPFNTYYYRF